MVQRLGNKAGDFWTLIGEESARLRLTSIVRSILQQLPQVVFTLRAAQYPTSIPVSMASLSLIQQSSNSFLRQVEQLFDGTESLGGNLRSLRKLYEADKIPNRILDGDKPYPENAQSLRTGIGVEFRLVLSVLSMDPRSWTHAEMCLSRIPEPIRRSYKTSRSIFNQANYA